MFDKSESLGGLGREWKAGRGTLHVHTTRPRALLCAAQRHCFPSRGSYVEQLNLFNFSSLGVTRESLFV